MRFSYIGALIFLALAGVSAFTGWGDGGSEQWRFAFWGSLTISSVMFAEHTIVREIRRSRSGR